QQAILLTEASKSRHAVRASEVMDGGPEQTVGTGLGIVPKYEDVQVVPARDALDEVEESRDDAFASAAIDAAGDDEADSHAAVSETRTRHRRRTARGARSRRDRRRARRESRSARARPVAASHGSRGPLRPERRTACCRS